MIGAAGVVIGAACDGEAVGLAVEFGLGGHVAHDAVHAQRVGQVHAAARVDRGDGCAFLVAGLCANADGGDAIGGLFGRGVVAFRSEMAEADRGEGVTIADAGACFDV